MVDKKTVPRFFWWLPRPRNNKYVGGFPKGFEIKLIKLLRLDPDNSKILHPFGGAGEYGDTVDLLSQKEFLAERGVKPTFWGDAHDLHFIEDNTYELTICDPPFSDAESKKLFGIERKLKRSEWVSEAVRVTRPNGFVALYHKKLLPNPDKCNWVCLIAIATRIFHLGRFCAVFSKDDPNGNYPRQTELTDYYEDE